MKKRYGDLLRLAMDGEFDVICHGANCNHTMGAGIAKQIRIAFPEAWQADLRTKKGDPQKLGDISVAEVVRGNRKFTIVNAYTQSTIGRGLQTSYEAVRECFQKIKAQFSGKRIGFPLIGCGLGGGDWKIVSKIIEEELDGEDYELVIFGK